MPRPRVPKEKQFTERAETKLTKAQHAALLEASKGRKLSEWVRETAIMPLIRAFLKR
jgi:hypothetical protein